MSESAARAVFLSYAREDAASGRRIAEALRSSGIEVWFDENELRGGDAWDQKIRRQIKDCGLFLAIISAHTHERGEGYFRLEWNLAVERTRLMMEGVPFLVPVVVDETPENTDMVPESFLRVQWTRLPKGLPSPQFVEQVKRLLEAPHKPVAGATQRGERGGQGTGDGGQPLVGRKIGAWALGALAVMVMVGVAVAFRVTHRPKLAASPVNDKSIAVVPFANMSDDKDTGFFADGIHEDILTNLQNIRELRVLSQQSVEQYRGSKKTMRQIGEELGVAYLLEGSVRRVNQTVRVTGQLIDARTEGHLWAKVYDRPLNDVFAIQSELAQAIANELKIALTPQEKRLVERRPTSNPAAYDLYQKAQDMQRRGFSNKEWPQYEALLQGAVELDPNFAEAWGALGSSRAGQYALHLDHSAAMLAGAKTAIDNAVRLAPDSPAIIGSLGSYYYRITRDYDRALQQFEQQARLQPNSTAPLVSIAAVQRRQGRWAESLANLRLAVQLDPGSGALWGTLGQSLNAGRHYEEAVAGLRRMEALRPETALSMEWGRASIQFLASGSTAEGNEVLAKLTPEQANSAEWIGQRIWWAELQGNFAEATRLDRLRPEAHDRRTSSGWWRAFNAALVLAAQDDRDGAKARLGTWPAELKSRLDLDPTNDDVWSCLGGMEMVLDHPEEALRCARKATELLPESRDAAEGPAHSLFLAKIQAWTGDKDGALVGLARLLRTPGIRDVGASTNVHLIKKSAGFYPLRDDPRFAALLADPKNNAPLF